MRKISYIGFCNASGYGQAAQDYINSLLINDYDLRIEAIGNQIATPGISDERFSLLKKLSKKDKTDDHIQIFHCVPTLQLRYKRMKRSIGFATFETFDPPDSGEMSWISILNNNDAVITPSRFNYHVFAHTRLKAPLFHIPHSIDTSIFHTDVKPSVEYDKFTFLFFGTWKQRKGYPQLLEAWFSEFDASDNVQLLIKTDKTSVAQGQIEQIKKNLGFKRKETAPILFENKIFNENELPNFFKSVDCLCLPTCGEGFCLPGLQCMAVGTPIIITNFSGPQDYANEETATLLQPRGYVLHECMDHYHQFQKRKWAFVAVKDIKIKMRQAVENYNVCQEKAINGAKFVADNFNYFVIHQKFNEMFTSIYG